MSAAKAVARQPSDSLEVQYGFERPLSLSEFAESLGALADLWSGEDNYTELALAGVRRGSAITELVPLAVAVAGHAYTAVDASVTISDFLRKLGAAISAFTERGPLARYNPDDLDLSELATFVRAIADTPGTDLSIRHVRRTKGSAATSMVTEVHIDRRTAVSVIEESEREEQSLLETRTRETEEVRRGEEFYLDQVSIDPPTSKGRSRDKAVVPSVSSKALPLFYSADSDLKERILSATENPLQTRYTADVRVNYVGGKPRSYEVLGFHDALMLPAPRKRGKQRG